MPIYIYYALLGFFLSLLIGRICIPRIIIVSKKKRLLDTPNYRKVHTTLTPRLGGISFFPAIVIAYCCTRGAYLSSMGGGAVIDPFFLQHMLFFFAGMMVIFITGFYDDIVGLSYRYKIILQLIATLMLVLPMNTIDNMYGLLGIHNIPLYIGIPFTTIIIVAVINSYNLIDGVDGLCSGLSILACLTYGIWFVYGGHYELTLLSFATIGVVTAFFMYNVFGKKLKIFMGDSGSLTMGYIIAFLSLQFIGHSAVTLPPVGNNYLIIALSIVFIPVFDTSRLFLTRMLNGKSPFEPDKNHIHHKFLRLGFNHIQSTMIILLIQAVYIAVNFLLVGRINVNLLLLVNLLSGMALVTFLNWRARVKGAGMPEEAVVEETEQEALSPLTEEV